MSQGRDVHDARLAPGRGAREQQVPEQVEQQEVRQVVRRELQLEAVAGAGLGRAHDRGVVDHHVEPAAAPAPELGRARPHARHVRLVDAQQVHAARVEEVAAERRPRLVEVPRRRVDGRAGLRQRAHRRRPHPRRRACDEDHLVAQGVAADE